MNKLNTMVLNGLKAIPFGTHVTIILNKTARMEAVVFGNRFGLKSGEFKTAEEITEAGWQVVLGWI